MVEIRWTLQALDDVEAIANYIAIMSESSLSKDWLKPEEDEAWQNL